MTHCQHHISCLYRARMLKHYYHADEWRLVPLRHWNGKWHLARSNYSTYDKEHLAGMLLLSSRSRILGTNPIVWLCKQEPVKTCGKGPLPEKANLQRWLTCPSQFRLTLQHTKDLKKKLAYYTSRENFDDLLSQRWVGRYLREFGLPLLTMQEEGLTKRTSCPSHCPSSGSS